MVVTGDNGLGHESAGVVVAVGEDVTDFKIGEFFFFFFFPIYCYIIWECICVMGEMLTCL